MKTKKTAAGNFVKLEAKPKRTQQGSGKHSKPSHNRKLSIGQGK